MVLAVFVTRPLLVMLKTPESILDWCHGYLLILLVGCIGSAYYNILGGILRGLGDAFSSLLYLLVATVINIILDLLFVAQFKMGVAGVAWATIIAQAISALLCYRRLTKMMEHFDMGIKYMRLNKKYSMGVIKLGLPSGLTQAIMSLAMITVQSLTNSFGEMFIAANVIVMRVDGFAMLPNFSFGTAMTTYAGQNVGACKKDRVIQGAKQGTLVAVLTSSVMTGLILLFGKQLMGIFTDTTELVPGTLPWWGMPHGHYCGGLYCHGDNTKLIRCYERRGRHTDTNVDFFVYYGWCARAVSIFIGSFE